MVECREELTRVTSPHPLEERRGVAGGRPLQTRIITLINISRGAADVIIAAQQLHKLQIRFITFDQRLKKSCQRQFFIKYLIRSGCNCACLTRWLSQSNKGR